MQVQSLAELVSLAERVGVLSPVSGTREEVTMAEINKLSVGKVLDKLRSNNAKNSKINTTVLPQSAIGLI